MEFVEIPRKKLPDGEIVSATRVRYLINRGEWEELRKLVSVTTLQALLRGK